MFIMYKFIKRSFDILISVISLLFIGIICIIFIPFYLFGSNKGPMFYKQKRIGYKGKPFYLYKFRSMIVNADEVLYGNKDLYKEFKENGYKLPDGKDPRITKFGSFIRKTSIDEIPQFINIFKGDMSLIGPRPVVEKELIEYGDKVNEFLSIKPGAMGYWQAIGRSNIKYPERCEVELYYVHHASLIFDLKILFKSIFSIFSGNGAY
ncbi:sugar transferase [Fructilactobacillus vespulae]|uniref:sugar transferase n=1 Tax=Fructilactobacillus vespulae TaxID=1249630 RepID=UPI0039B5A33C